jgi:hypothetical protein
VESTGGMRSSSSEHGRADAWGVREGAVERGTRESRDGGHRLEREGGQGGLHICTQGVGNVEGQRLKTPLLRRHGVVSASKTNARAGLGPVEVGAVGDVKG